MKKILYFFLTISLLYSCSPLDKEIIKSTAGNDILEIKKNLTDKDSLKIYTLDNILAMSEGYNSYLKYRDIDEDDILIDYIIDEDEFNNQIETLFEKLKDIEATYAMLFDEIELVQQVNEKYSEELAPTYKLIDSLCYEYQMLIDNEIVKKEKLKDSINNFVTLKIVDLKETELDYRDVIQVKIQMINNTNKVVEAISFNINIIDKLGTELATLRCRSNDRFSKSDFGYWIYDEYDNREIYKNLKNTKLSHISYTQKINKINLNGNILDADTDEINIDFDSDFEFIINSNYKRKEFLYGYCPYLKEDSELYKKVEESNSKQDKEIEKLDLLIVDIFNNFSLFKSND